ncbi:MAG: hypothetical protein IPJ84_00805 [Bdellovibrionales bacterium]|nr:hypothetical protein [Bdellovibrionales bacterium]
MIQCQPRLSNLTTVSRPIRQILACVVGPALFAVLLSFSLVFPAQATAQQSPSDSAPNARALIDLVISRAFKLESSHLLFRAVELEAVGNDHHSKIEVERSGGRIIINFIYDKVALQNPAMLFPDLVLLSAITSINTKVTGSPLNFDPSLAAKFGDQSTLVFPKSRQRFLATWIEVFRNAQQGSATANLAMTWISLLAQKALAINSESEETLRSIGLGREKRAEAIRITQTTLERLAADAQGTDVALKRFTSSSPAGNQSALLDRLILNNDRAGVAKMFQDQLPWDFMEPTEKMVWTEWIGAIEKPDDKNTEILFRGIGVQNRVLSLEKGENTSWAFLSAGIQGSDGLAHLFQRSRDVIGNLFGEGSILSPTISLQLKRHAFASKDSNFISFTSDYMTAAGFIGNAIEPEHGKHQGLLGVRLDRRRTLPNFTSEMNEKEYLVPLLIFPDEVVFFEEATALTREQFKDRPFAENLLKRANAQSTAQLNFDSITDDGLLNDKFERDSVDALVSLFSRSSTTQRSHLNMKCMDLFSGI